MSELCGEWGLGQGRLWSVQVSVTFWGSKAREKPEKRQNSLIRL